MFYKNVVINLNKIKVLVVEDSSFMRKMIKQMLEEDERIEVIATARDGYDALKKIKSKKPDVVTLDIEMPKLNGIETLKEIMKTTKTPTIIVSITTTEGAKNTITAIQLGAIDFIPKPLNCMPEDIIKIKDSLIEKVLIASKTNNHKKIEEPPKEPKKLTKENNIKKTDKKIICIASSTGGPKALHEVIPKLPKDIKAPILIVQHMPPNFTKSLAERLNQISNIHVKEAEHEEEVFNGTAYLAPGGFHMEIKEKNNKLYIELNKKNKIKGHRPASDMLFYSVAQLKKYSPIAIILTGMGSDGTNGLVTLKENNNVFSIAESEESCVVFGMPKVAIENNLIDKIAHIRQIPSIINDFF